MSNKIKRLCPKHDSGGGPCYCGNIVSFPEKPQEFNKISYTDNQGDIGISTLDSRLEIVCLNKKDFLVITPDGSQIYDREALSEFLWVAAQLVDSQEKWRPPGDLVGRDY